MVVVFLSFDCPVSKNYSQPLADLAQAYPDVAFVGLTSDEDETPAQIARYLREYKLPFPLLKDAQHRAADSLKAETTPEAFLLDDGLVLRYRGRIDNSYAARLKKNNQTTHHDLRQAIDELLAGKAVSEPATRAVGCPIPRRSVAKGTSSEVTFYRDVLPMLQNNCQDCHRPGEVGPFSLMTYHQAVNWASDIKEFTQKRKMPPWKPVAGQAFHNERKLSDHEIATLAAWVDNDTPEGNPKDAPAPRQFVDGWHLGKPDLVLTPSADFEVAASGNDLFRCFVLPTNLAEGKYVAAVEVRPGNPKVVHHALLAVDAQGQGRKLEQAQQEKESKTPGGDRGPGYPVSMGFGFFPQAGMGGWAPGQLARYLPDGAGYYLPKNSDVVIQVHYHRNGRAEKDRLSVGLYFARKPVQRRFQSLTIPGRFSSIPAGAQHFLVQGTVWIDQDATLYSVMPHMHMLGREIKVTMTPPGGAAQTLVAINDWDYNWQETYLFKQPLAVKAGTRFDVEAFYDNSNDNLYNPYKPPRRIFFGQQTTDEMCFVFLGATADKPGRLRPRLRPPQASTAKQIPYRLTETNHVLVRVKINGKGPYNFILDTGAPTVFVATDVCRKLGIKPGRERWGTFERFELEGGAVVQNARGKIEDPFQLEGMNGLGLAGVRLDGIIGYTLLARFRMEFDFTRHKMKWTPLDYNPGLPDGIGSQNTPEGMEAASTVLKLFGTLLGKPPESKVVLRGFLGVGLADEKETVRITRVLPGSPAAEGGLQEGDLVQRFQGKTVASAASVHRLAEKLEPDETIEITVGRAGKTVPLRIKAGRGL